MPTPTYYKIIKSLKFFLVLYTHFRLNYQARLLYKVTYKKIILLLLLLLQKINNEVRYMNVNIYLYFV